MKNTTCNATVGVFETREAAERAIEDLKNCGVSNEEISHIWKKRDGETFKADGSGMTAEEKGAAVGGTTGLAAGAAAGAAVGYGVLAGVIPVIGPVLAIGTLGTILLNAAGGAAIAGIAGALIGWGVSEDEAKFYEGEVAAGKHLVTVNSKTMHEKTINVYSRNGGTYRTPIHTPVISV